MLCVHWSRQCPELTEFNKRHKNTAACKIFVKNTVTRSNVMSTGRSSHVLQGLKELRDLHQPLLSSMRPAMETITQNKTSRKRKRDEMSDSNQ